jgi:hypothetical protein
VADNIVKQPDRRLVILKKGSGLASKGKIRIRIRVTKEGIVMVYYFRLMESL